MHADELGDPPEIELETAVSTSTDKLDDPLSSDPGLPGLNTENQVKEWSDTWPPSRTATVEREFKLFSSEVGLFNSFTLIITALLVGDGIYENAFLICTYPGQLSTREAFRAYAFASGLAAVFGVMHTAAWSFDFPSSAEQTVWRTLTVLLVVIPVYSFLFSLHIYRKGITLSTITRRESGLLTAIAYRWMPSCLTGVYILSRLVLLVLMFVLLRKVPLGVYETVSWTNYVSHF